MLTVSFDTEIRPYQIPAFRGAFAHKVGLEHDWFHNHLNDFEPLPDRLDAYPSDSSFHYRYPLIQYKMDGARPMLLCLDEGVDQAHLFFSQPDWSMQIHGVEHEMNVDRMKVKQFNMQVWKHQFQYNLFKWQAFNSRNWQAYQEKQGIVRQTQFLERILRGHILGFASGIGWEVEDNIELAITAIKREKWVSFKRTKILTLDLSFQTNVFLPEFVGLGKGVSKGFGVIRRPRRDGVQKNRVQREIKPRASR